MASQSSPTVKARTEGFVLVNRVIMSVPPDPIEKPSELNKYWAGYREPRTGHHRNLGHRTASGDDTLLTSWQHFIARGAGKFMHL